MYAHVNVCAYVSAADTDHSGEIEYEEFARVMTYHLSQINIETTVFAKILK